MSTTEAQPETAGTVGTAPFHHGQPGRWRRRSRAEDGIHHTRIGGAWVAVGIAVVLGAALIDFVVQNTRSVRVEFFGANGHMPVAVALLGAALVGAFLVLAVGVARTTQLRMANRRGQKRSAATAGTTIPGTIPGE